VSVGIVTAHGEAYGQGMAPLELSRSRLRDRNFILGNKAGLMVHLPVANGASERTFHRSKWYGASRLGCKYLEGILCYANGALLRRALQVGFRTDGLVASRLYEVGGARITETYFVPDNIRALIWGLEGDVGDLHLCVEPRLDITLLRGPTQPQGYHAHIDEQFLVVSRTVEMPLGDVSEGVDTGGTPIEVREEQWVAIASPGAQTQLAPTVERWKPIWYSMDAERRRYLRRLGAQHMGIVEHAPRWELTRDWLYSPASVSASGPLKIYFGFGSNVDEAIEACTQATDDSELRVKKARALRRLVAQTEFASGHEPTDRAYAHVLSRLRDCLIVYGDDAPTVRGGTVLAGNAYFQESWKRDENICLGGLLAVGQYEICRRIIDETWSGQDPVTGRLPLRSRPGEVAGYTASDATLWALIRLVQYWRCTGDLTALDTKLPMVENFFLRSLESVRAGLLPSGGIAVAEHGWETWMDTEFSSRKGFPVEIQFLWIACLVQYAALFLNTRQPLAAKMLSTATQARVSLARFLVEWSPATATPAQFFCDHLTETFEPIPLLTPNGFFWSVLGLNFEPEWEDAALRLARSELAGTSGIRTLARSQWTSVLGDEIAGLARRGRPLPSVGKTNYHRGVEWNWLSQLFVAAELKHARPDVAFERYLLRQLTDATTMGGLGGVSEVFDHRGPAGPNFQAWSMTSLLESLHRFSGVDIDVPGGQLSISPQLPRRWPHLRVVKWFGTHPVDISYSSTTRSQTMEVKFQRDTPEGVTLTLQFNLATGSHPIGVHVQSVGETTDVPWTHRLPSHGTRNVVEVVLPARSRQTVTVETARG
jgi:glycogen debranching enzyme